MKNIIPVMHPFVHSVSALDFRGIPLMNESRKEILERVKREKSSVATIAGGFFEIGKPFVSKYAVKSIETLVKDTNRRFRLGTCSEMFSFYRLLRQHLPEKDFVSIDHSLIEDSIVFSSRYREFGFAWLERLLDSGTSIFIVEEL